MNRIALALALVLTACGDKPTETPEAAPPAAQPGELPAGHPPANAANPAAAPGQAPAAANSGTVKETMAAGGYTYVLLKTADKEFWVAGPETKLAVGETISVGAGSMMQGFHSATLERTFDEILFVQAIFKGAAPAAASGTAAAPVATGDGPKSSHAPPAVKDIKVAVAENGQTVGDIYDKYASLTGKPVSVRGQVAKFSPAIMGTNWIHLQDGTGGADTYDLTVTTDAMVTVGDVILVSGTLQTNKDVGAGYHYDVIVEKATVVVEGK